MTCVRLTRKCAGCKQDFRKDELIQYSSITGKTSYWYCKNCYEEKLSREKFVNKVCEIFGLKSPGPLIWTQRKQLKEKENKPKYKFDYGIAAGLGLELHIKPIGRFQIEGRYYYGLGNLYGDSKTDCFSRSAHKTIILRGAYLIDI